VASVDERKTITHLTIDQNVVQLTLNGQVDHLVINGVVLNLDINAEHAPTARSHGLRAIETLLADRERTLAKIPDDEARVT